MNNIRAITAIMVAAIALFKVGDLSQMRISNSSYSNEESYLFDLVQLFFQTPNNDNTESFELNWEKGIELLLDDTNNLDAELP